MGRRRLGVLVRLLAAVAAIPLGIGTALAGIGAVQYTDSNDNPLTINTYYANSPILTKFTSALPGLGPTAANNLGQYIPVAVADTVSFPAYTDNNAVPPKAWPASQYYELGIVEYAEQMHQDLKNADGTPHKTRLRGYVQIETPAVAAAALAAGTPSLHFPLAYPDGTPILDAAGLQVYGVDKPHYLGPVIVAVQGTPVRIKYTNYLPKGAPGNLFIPVDKTLMGAGAGPHCVTAGTITTCEDYTENRAEIHLHGGDNPWISDGTPFQWTAPAGETTTYPKGESFANVPDMTDPGDGSGTLFYPNGDSGRLMFYHDHAVGLTRLNVYAGEAAGYLLVDSTERALMASWGIPATREIPLVIQERTFVPTNVLAPDPVNYPPANYGGLSFAQDTLWDTTHWGQPGDLWFPHVYETNQLPGTVDGTNPAGRWDYGPWFWPIFPPANFPLPTGAYGDATTTPEAFGDTPIINGTAYPTLTVGPVAYRFRILNAANDRGLNLGLYVAEPYTIMVRNGGAGYPAPPLPAPAVTIANCTGYVATASVDFTGAVSGVNVTTYGTCTGVPTVTVAGGTTPATFYVSQNTEVKMVPAAPPVPGVGLQACPLTPQGAPMFVSPVTGEPMADALFTVPCWPAFWPTDGRDGGVPDPSTAGPKIVQIGSEGGLLPKPAEIPSTPTGYEYFRRSVTVLNVSDHGLFLMPAERADVIVDFSGFAGKTLILYNDMAAPIPAFDPRIDYYTGDPDQSDSGGWFTTLPGQGPNTRTLMQITVNAGTGTPFAPATPLATSIPAAYQATQPKPVVAEAVYNAAFGTAYPNQYARIFTGSATQHTFDFIAGDTFNYVPEGASAPVTVLEGALAHVPVKNKAIQELFDPWGRMNATLGIELPFTNANTQTTIPLGYLDPVTDTVADGETQIWKITHNGVDSHPVHFHLVNVQVINRIGWDGTVKPPSANELGWKETVRMNPLEDILVAVRAKKPSLPGFSIPVSKRHLDPTMPDGVPLTFTNPVDGNAITKPNLVTDFGWEYVWHCHILGHEENDFMRPFVFTVPETKPIGPANLVVALTGTAGRLSLTWQDKSSNEIGFKIFRAQGTGAYTQIGTALANAGSYLDTTVPTVVAATNILYQVFAYNAAGNSVPATGKIGLAPLVITSPATLPNATGGVIYSYGLAATGGVAPFTWSLTGGALPTGIILTASGGLTGRPTAFGAFSFTATVRDSYGSITSKAFSLTANPPPVTITTASLPQATPNAVYNVTLTATGGIPGFTWAAVGALPGGLTLSAGGVLSGQPTVLGSFQVTARVTDSIGTTAQRTWTLSIAVPALTILSPATLPAAVTTAVYSYGLAASGGVLPYSWTRTAGTLPPGVTLTAGGGLTGRPTATGVYSFTARVTDRFGANVSKAFSLTVN